MAQRVGYKQKNIRLFLTGDVMTGRGIDQVLPYSVNPELHESYIKDARKYAAKAGFDAEGFPDAIPYDYIWGDALKEFRKWPPDLKVINLETAVTTSECYWKEKRIHYRMHPENVRLLTHAGIDVCVLANNHIMDWGHSGLEETLLVLKEAGLKTAGAGMDAQSAAAPAVITTALARVLIFSYAVTDAGVLQPWKAGKNRSGINLLAGTDYGEAEKVLEHVRSIKKDKDLVILSIHWGGNWGYEITEAERRFAHRLVEKDGVDIVHGHSSHHPKGVEVHNERLILYGCGDLINDYEGIRGYEGYRDDLPLLYFPELTLSGRLHGLRMVPMQLRRFRLHYANKNSRRMMFERLNKECRKLGTGLKQNQEGAFMLQW